MAFKLPWSNFHELNLDWLLEKMKELEEKVNNIVGGATPATNTPNMDGVGSAGSSISYSRGDHTHPTDTSRASASDLAALDNTVYNNYVTLNGNINTVDAKIAFSSAAPQVDGVASPGSSAYQARADHVHPTDTSRASKSEFDTLKATVDSWQGSASPYALTPEPDGAGSPGIVAAYARGDHQHPRDPGVLPLSGGVITGDLRVKTVYTSGDTNATGWLRVAAIPRVAGTTVRFMINRKGVAGTAPAEIHEITLDLLRSAVNFGDEYADGDALYINKVRYMDSEYLDIHVDNVTDSNIGIAIEKCAPTEADYDNIETITPVWVADAPDGETVLQEKSLAQRTVGNAPVTVFSKTWYLWKRGSVASISFSGVVGEAVAAGSHAVYTLPTGWKPYYNMSFPVTEGPAGAYLNIVSSSGSITFVNATAMAQDDPLKISATWTCS